MKKINYLIVSLFFFAISYNIIFKDKIVLGIYGTEIINLEKKLIVLIPIIIVGLFLFYLFLKTKYKKEIEYSKCPKCDIKTVDIEKYYNKSSKYTD